MSKFRKKPVVINAWETRQLCRLAKNAWNSLPSQVSDAYERGGIIFISVAGGLSVVTKEGVMHAAADDMLICGVQGELYPCKPDIFEATYEPAD